MKITYTLLALAAAGFLGNSAFATDANQPLGLAVMPDGHGGTRVLYFQANPDQNITSVALSTSSGGIVSPMTEQVRVQSDNGQVRYVIGTNQHAQAQGAYIPQNSHFAPAQQ